VTGYLVYLAAVEHSTELGRKAAAARALRAERDAKRRRHLDLRLGGRRDGSQAAPRHLAPSGC